MLKLLKAFIILRNINRIIIISKKKLIFIKFFYKLNIFLNNFNILLNNSNIIIINLNLKKVNL